MVSIESSLGARLQVSHVQEERAGAVHDSRHWRWSEDGVASERGDVRDLSSSLSVALSRASSLVMLFDLIGGWIGGWIDGHKQS